MTNNVKIGIGSLLVGAFSMFLVSKSEFALELLQSSFHSLFEISLAVGSFVLVDKFLLIDLDLTAWRDESLPASVRAASILGWSLSLFAWIYYWS